MNRRDFLAGAAVVAVGARAPQALARAAGGVTPTPLALVTADTEARIALVRPGSGGVVGWIETLPGPRSIESGNEELAVVAHTQHGRVSIVDGRARRVRHVVAGFSEPRYTAAHPDGQLAFVSDSRRGEVVTLDVRAGRVAGRVAVGGPARHISLAASGRLLWVSLGSKAKRIAVVDVARPERPRLLRHLTPPFRVHDVGFAPQQEHVWVTGGDADALLVYHARTGEVLHRLPADAPPQHVTFLGGRAYVTSGDDGTFHVHALDDGRILRRTPVPVGSYNVQEGCGLVLTPSLDRGTLCVVDARGRLLRRVQVAPSSHDACFVTA